MVKGYERFQKVNIRRLIVRKELILQDNAKVTKMLDFDITRMLVGTGSPPGLNKLDGFRTYDFDKDTDEDCFAIFYGPLDWDSASSATFRIGYFVDTAPATAQNVVWGIEYKSIEGDGVFDFSSGTSIVLATSNVTLEAPANNQKIHSVELVVPNIGLISGGILMVRVYRDANHASDTFNGDARMIDVHLHYTANKLGTSQ